MLFIFFRKKNYEREFIFFKNSYLLALKESFYIIRYDIIYIHIVLKNFEFTKKLKLMNMIYVALRFIFVTNKAKESKCQVSIIVSIYELTIG